jgi:hypothetical protein
MVGEPLYATTITEGAHLSNSRTQLESVLQETPSYKLRISEFSSTSHYFHSQTDFLPSENLQHINLHRFHENYVVQEFINQKVQNSMAKLRLF